MLLLARWVLEEVRRYLSPDIKVRRGDVLSAWSGLRPLVRNPSASSTEGLVRNHMIHVSDSGLLTIAGGKWTTYRAMAEETVDEAVKVFGLQGKVKSGCVTDKVRLVGSDGWSRNMFLGLTQRVSPLITTLSLTMMDTQFNLRLKYGLASEVAQHLAENYGDRAWTVLALAKPTGESWPKHGIKLAPQYPCMLPLLFALSSLLLFLSITDDPHPNLQSSKPKSATPSATNTLSPPSTS